MARVEPRPGGGGPRPKTDAMLRRFARFVLSLIFREFDLIGADRLPASGPVIVIANHSNSIIDGAILLGYLPRIPRFLAASTVWDHKPVAPFMDASGSVKVFRQQDGRAHEGSLEESFSEAAGLLADGGVLAVFPEGRTHDDPALLSFKTGAARIAAFTEAKHALPELPIVPVGIDYEVKNLFRTRACFTFGAPVTPGAGAGGATGRESGDVRASTAAFQRALSAVAPDFADPDEAAPLALAGAIRSWQAGARPGRAPAFSRIVAFRREVQAAFARAEAAPGDQADTASEARAALGAYAKALGETGLPDHEVAAPEGPRRMTRSALALLPGLPLTLLAALLNGPQAFVLRAVSRSKPRDRQMTWMVFGGIVLYPLTWMVWAIAFGLLAGSAYGAGWGWGAVVATLVAAPLSARLALPTIDRGVWIARALRARRVLRRDPGQRDRLIALRAAAEAALDALLQAAPNRSD